MASILSNIFGRRYTIGELMFQSTLPHGERRERGCGAGIGGEVSIHAPTWGATYSRGWYAASGITFQSTLPHGERPGVISGSSVLASFNPRSHMGSDSA